MTEHETHEQASEHDNFDWALGNQNVNPYSKEEQQALDEMYDKTFRPIEEGKVVTGVVAGVNKQNVFVNIGYKSDGLISANEFRDMPDLKEGDEIEVFVIEKENRQGHLKLSRRLAVLEHSWERIKQLYETGEVVTGEIISKTKGGLIATIYGFDTFVPGSQISVKPITDYDQFVGRTMEFKVIKINEHIRNAVVSHRILIESDVAAQRSEIMDKLEKGQIIEGVVKNITNFGAFLDLGGLDGLLYITDITWGRVSHPSDVLQIDQKLNVVVLDFDEGKKRISLGLKQLTPHPWENLPEHIQEGAKVNAKVVNVEDYGAFLEIAPGIEGLVHVSEITWDSVMIHSREFFKLGEYHDVKITRINHDDKKMSLSIKRLLPNPWDDIDVRFPVGSLQQGTVKNLSAHSVLVELAPGIVGFVHVSDLSWTRHINHPSQFVKIGSPFEVVVLNIDKDNRKLQLGHKQREESPWLALQEIFQIGSAHEGTITRKNEKSGAIVSMPYGIEAFCPAKQLHKQEGGELGVDDTAQFVVINFDASDRKIVVSHTRFWEQEHNRAEQNENRQTQRNTNTFRNKVEKYTLGDLGALNEIRKRLTDEEKQAEKQEKTQQSADSPSRTQS